MINADRERLEKTMTALHLFEPDMVIPCHCTGELAVAMLRDTLGERVSPASAGMTYCF